MSKKPIDFKDPLFALNWLDTAIDFERRKLTKCPVLPDMAPGHEAAQGWAYVVAGYFLLEQAFKLLLHLRNTPPARTHALSSDLYDLLPAKDKDILREYYRDYREGCDHATGFPFQDLDSFLSNLDGQTSGGRFVGSFDWRYYLIEKMSGSTMPIVSIEMLHEVAYGATCIIEYLVHDRFEPSRYTYSHRMYWDRKRKYLEWMTVRINTPGLDLPEGGLEILWGPDYRDRYDFLIHQGNGRFTIGFNKLPEDQGLQIMDKSDEVEASDADEGFRSIGVVRPSPRGPRGQEAT